MTLLDILWSVLFYETSVILYINRKIRLVQMYDVML
jgi:hypothetical protein